MENFQRKQAISLTWFRIQESKPHYITIVEQITPKEVLDDKGDRVFRDTMIVLDLETKNQYFYGVKSMVKRELEEKFPNNSYVGKSFEITLQPKSGKGKERKFSIYELGDVSNSVATETEVE